MKIIKECTLDCARFNSFKTYIAKQNDSNSRFIKVTLADDGEPLTVDDGNLVFFNVKRSDSKAKIFEGSVEDGKLMIPIPNWALEKEGIIECDISVLGSDTQEKLSSTKFQMMVESCVANSEEVSKDENYDFLFELITKADDAVNSCEAATKNATDIYNEIEQKLNDGQLKGEKGEPFKYSDFTPEQLEGLRGPQGKTGPKGQKGDSYILTDADKAEIAQKVNLPTKTSALENDSGFVSDSAYVHTDNNYTDEDKTKLAGLSNYDDTVVKKSIAAKQDKLTTAQLNAISAVSGKQDKLTDTQLSNISAVPNKQDKLSQLQLDNISNVTNKQDKLTVGSGLKLENNVLSLDIETATAQTTYGGDTQ